MQEDGKTQQIATKFFVSVAQGELVPVMPRVVCRSQWAAEWVPRRGRLNNKHTREIWSLIRTWEICLYVRNVCSLNVCKLVSYCSHLTLHHVHPSLFYTLPVLICLIYLSVYNLSPLPSIPHPSLSSGICGNDPWAVLGSVPPAKDPWEPVESKPAPTRDPFSPLTPTDNRDLDEFSALSTREKPTRSTAGTAFVVDFICVLTYEFIF